jgi:hypothetical protein
LAQKLQSSGASHFPSPQVGPQIPQSCWQVAQFSPLLQTLSPQYNPPLPPELELLDEELELLDELEEPDELDELVPVQSVFTEQFGQSKFMEKESPVAVPEKFPVVGEIETPLKSIQPAF